MKKNKIRFYTLLGFLVVVSNVIIDLRTESLAKALIDLLFTIPVTVLFIIVVSYLRSLLVRTSFYNRLVEQDEKDKLILVLTIVVISKSLLLALCMQFVHHLLFDHNRALIDFAFWILLVSALTIVIFIYLLEAFFEGEQQRLKMLTTFKDFEHDKEVARYQSIKKQLNPHFLFNSFNSLSSLIGIDEKQAELFLQELAEVYRYTLQHNDEVLVSLQNEIKMITSYFYLQKIRFRESITLDLHIPAGKMNYLLPPMTLELLVENAIKHNKKDPQNPLHISITVDGERLQVKNNHRPREVRTNNIDGFGIGLKNLKSQYEFLHTQIPEFYLENDNYMATIPLIRPEL